MRAYTMHEALTYGKGVERPFLCPVHGDSRPSASVNTVKMKWVCYTCGAGGSVTGEDRLVEPDYEVMQTWFEQKLEEQRVYPESWLARYTAGDVHPYWTERVGTGAAEHFQLGWDMESDSVTYPLRDNQGRVLGVVRRRLQDSSAGVRGRSGPKYLYPTGVDVGRLLFNYTPEQRDIIFLVEGALDAIALWNAGYTAFAIYGSRLGPEQIKLIDRVDPRVVVTAFDMDDAGFAAHCEVQRRFKHRRVARLRWPKGWGKDVDEIGQEKLKNIVQHLVSGLGAEIGSEAWEPSRSSEIPRSKKPRVRVSVTSSGSTSRPKRPSPRLRIT